MPLPIKNCNNNKILQNYLQKTRSSVVINGFEFWYKIITRNMWYKIVVIYLVGNYNHGQGVVDWGRGWFPSSDREFGYGQWRERLVLVRVKILKPSNAKLWSCKLMQVCFGGGFFKGDRGGLIVKNNKWRGILVFNEMQQ